MEFDTVENDYENFEPKTDEEEKEVTFEIVFCRLTLNLAPFCRQRAVALLSGEDG